METEHKFIKRADYGNYSIFEIGMVWSKITKRFLKPQVSSPGYLQVCLYVNGRPVWKLIHRLVAEHFVPGRTDERNEIDHIDNDKTNNMASNLRWVSRKENVQKFLREKDTYDYGLTEQTKAWKRKYYERNREKEKARAREYRRRKQEKIT